MQSKSTCILAIGLSTALVLSACTGGGRSTQPLDAGSKLIPQPPVPNVHVAPESERVDLRMPSFSNPTNITNPLFPVSKQSSVLLVGRVQGKPFRTEVTLLPDTRIVEWQGQLVESRISQYVAYLDGRITEVAYDLYAQADDRSVWYLGEDVFDFTNGAIVSTEGTWLAGRDGPAAMIMPAHPKAGDVYRTENAPGLVFEEVTVKSVDKTLAGPLHQIGGGLIGRELHQDGGSESKTFAPNYGEFYTATGGEIEALALAVPTDALSQPVPPELDVLEGRALAIFDAAQSGGWHTASAAIKEMTAAWERYRKGGVPRLIEPLLTRDLRSLSIAADARDKGRTRQAAIDVARWSLDLQLRYRPRDEIDFARADLWAAQVLIDAGRKDSAGVNSDFFAIDYIQDRVRHTLHGADLVALNTQLGELQTAVIDANFPAVRADAQRLRGTLARLGPG
jgi:hypothetical protein